MYKHLFAILSMGDYGWYVWPCYFLVVVVFILHLYFAFKTQRDLEVKFREHNESRT